MVQPDSKLFSAKKSLDQYLQYHLPRFTALLFLYTHYLEWGYEEAYSYGNSWH